MPPVRPRLSRRTLAFATLAQCFSLSALAATTCHVTPDGAPVANGWATTTTLHAALADSACQEIWVARGVYRPSASGDTTVHFAINRPLRLYGGFAGTETTLAQRRLSADSAAQSILSGDLNGDDLAAPSEVNRTDNSRHVLIIGGTDSAQGNGLYTANEGDPTYTVVDGFTLQGGDALGQVGAGLLCNGAGTGRECSPLLQHLTFRHNRAAYGAALYNSGEGGRSNPVIRYSVFEYNRASSDGGAIYNLGSINPASAAGEARPTISHSTFHNNLAGQGSAIYNIGYGKGHAHPVIEFSTLTATTVTGPLLYNNAYAVSADNTSTFGAYATVTGSIVWGAGSSSQSYVNALPKVGIYVTRSVFKGGTGTYVQDNGGLVDVDPLLGALQDNGGATRSALPAAASPAVDGYGACPSAGLTDQRGVARPDGAGCDLGAVERIVTARTLQVTVTGQGSVTGDATHAASLQCETGNTGTCTTSHSEGTLLPTLTATPAPGYRFAGWSGDCGATSGACTLGMTANRSVTAKFVWHAHTGAVDGQSTTATLDPASSCEFADARFEAAGTPAGLQLPYGQFSFRAINCTPGAPLTVTLKLPETIPPGAQLRKFITGQGWVVWPATIVGDTLSYQVRDAELPAETGASTGDGNATPGVIDDPVALALPAAAGAVTPVPSLSHGALLLLALALFAATLHQRQRTARRH